MKTIDSIDIKQICYFKTLGNEFENLDEMNKTLEKHNLSKLTQKELEKLLVLYLLKIKSLNLKQH